MAEKQPFLSISLLSSGRIDTIERCLASFAPIRARVDTEVIVVDTDPEHREEVREILDKYADRVISFEWNNDFSAARNAGVDAAKGDWFLFVDDDEWFIDAEPLADFLLSPESKDFFWANLKIRNFKDEALTTGEYAWVSRLFRLDRGIRFKGAIHEYFEPIIGKPKVIESLFGHTGYVYRTDEERAAHARRNLSLLKPLLKREPRQIRWVMQAMTEYDDLKDWEKELSYARRGYRLMEDAEGNQNALIRGAFAANQLRMLTMLERWQDCIDTYKKLLQGKRIGKVARAQLELDAARSSYELEKNEQASRHCREYLALYDEMTSQPVDEADEFMSILTETFRDVNHDYIAAIFIYLGITMGDWSAFDRYFDSIKWGGNGGYDTAQYERNIFYAIFQKGYDEHLVHLVSVFWLQVNTRKMLQEVLQEGMEHGAAKSGDKAYWGLVHAIAEADIPQNTPWDVKVLWADYAAEKNGIRGALPMDMGTPQSGDDRKSAKTTNSGGNDQISKAFGRDVLQEYFRRLFEIINPLLIDPKLWEIGLRRGAMLDERIKEIPMERWQACVEGFARDVDAEFALKMAGLLEEVYMGLPDEHYQYFLARTADMLAEAEETKRQTDEARKQQEARASAQKEMKEIIDALQGKVDELVSAGMIEEADEVLKEIQKYTDMMG